MAEIPYPYKIDDKNGVVDGRDFALKCMMHAYELLGPYARGDAEVYRKLVRITEHLAELELAMKRDPDKDEEIPRLSIVIDEKDPEDAARRIEQHLNDTADRTEVLLKMAEGRGV